MRNRYEEAFHKAAEKYSRGAAIAAKEGLIPYKSEKGAWIPSPYDGNGWWTGGFYPAIFWQMYVADKREEYLAEARRVEKLLTEEFRGMSRPPGIPSTRPAC